MNDEPAGRNEIGRLSRHLQQMQHSLGMTVGTVRQGAEEIYRGTSEISAGNADLSSRTEEQAAAIEQTAASMEQLTARVRITRIMPANWRKRLLLKPAMAGRRFPV